MADILEAACNGDIAAIERLLADGAHVSERNARGTTAIMVAAMHGSATTVKFLQSAGASTTEKDNHGFSALHYAAHNGRLSLLQYFFEEVGASFSDAIDKGNTVWAMLKLKNADPVALASLLKVMVMLGDALPAFVAKLSTAHAELITRGRHLRMQLPSYLEKQRASIFEYCPLQSVLNNIIGAYAATTPEDMWMDGLRFSPFRRSLRLRLFRT
jgi:ankyrin repeat protein